MLFIYSVWILFLVLVLSYFIYDQLTWGKELIARLVPYLYVLAMAVPFRQAPIKGTLANSVDRVQTPQNAASDQGIHCLQ